MAQEQYVKRRDLLSSWIQNLAFISFLNPGRYRGFDKANFSASMQFSLGHNDVGTESQAGGRKVSDPNNTVKGPWGMYMTKQGVEIYETATINNIVTIPSNGGNAFVRYDAVCATHNYVSSGSQTPATYYVVQGPTGYQAKPLMPTFLNEYRDIVLGWVAVPASASASLVGATWIPNRTPGTGDSIEARVDQYNKFTKRMDWAESKTYAFANTGAGPVEALVIDEGSNIFDDAPASNHTVHCMSKPKDGEGAEIRIRVSPGSNRQIIMQTQTASSIDTNVYAPFYIPPYLYNYNSIPTGGSIMGLRLRAGDVATFVYMNDPGGSYWVLMGFIPSAGSSIEANSTVPFAARVGQSWAVGNKLSGVLTGTTYSNTGAFDNIKVNGLIQEFDGQYPLSNLSGFIKMEKAGYYRLEAFAHFPTGNGVTTAMNLGLTIIANVHADLQPITTKYGASLYGAKQNEAVNASCTLEFTAGDFVTANVVVTDTNSMSGKSITVLTQMMVTYLGPA